MEKEYRVTAKVTAGYLAPQPFPTRTAGEILGRTTIQQSGRPHKEFLTNLSVPSQKVMQVFIDEWRAESEYSPLPKENARIWVETKYAREDWNLKF